VHSSDAPASAAFALAWLQSLAALPNGEPCAGSRLTLYKFSRVYRAFPPLPNALPTRIPAFGTLRGMLRSPKAGIPLFCDRRQAPLGIGTTCAPALDHVPQKQNRGPPNSTLVAPPRCAARPGGGRCRAQHADLYRRERADGAPRPCRMERDGKELLVFCFLSWEAASMKRFCAHSPAAAMRVP
jgi:hypothetical protein